MQFTDSYQSPLGEILLAADDTGLTGLWFYGQEHFAEMLDPEHEEKALPVLEDAKRWLDIYFTGKEPDFTVPLHMIGTDFQIEVWKILCSIPYGDTVSYGAIADQLTKQNDRNKMSSRAVGAAIAHNPISIIVPCHRVIKANGEPGGYAGGTERKLALLKLEQATSESDAKQNIF